MNVAIELEPLKHFFAIDYQNMQLDLPLSFAANT